MVKICDFGIPNLVDVGGGGGVEALLLWVPAIKIMGVKSKLTN